MEDDVSLVQTGNVSPVLLSALQVGRFKRLSYDKSGALSERQSTISCVIRTQTMRISLKKECHISPGRTLYRADEPECDSEISAMSTADSVAVSDTENALTAELEETDIMNHIPNVELEDAYEDECSDFGAILQVEDGLNYVPHELALWEERRHEVTNKTMTARQDQVWNTFAFFRRIAEEKKLAAIEAAAEERRRRNLEADKDRMLWTAELQKLSASIKRSHDSKAEELQTKTETIEEAATQERSLLQARFQIIIDLEKSISDKIAKVHEGLSEFGRISPRPQVTDSLRAHCAPSLNQAKNLLDASASRKSEGIWTEKDVAHFQQQDLVMAKCLSFVKEAQEKLKARLAEQERAFEAEKSAVAVVPSVIAKSAAPPRSSFSVIKEYERLLSRIEDVSKVAEAISSEGALKKYRFLLQKAVNLPINAMSNDVTSNFRQMTDRLISLLRGQVVEAGGNETVTTSLHPAALPFCMLRMAKMFVRQAEEQVASKQESAFPLAATIVSIWQSCPEWGDVFLGTLFKTCPYIVPYYPKLSGDAEQKIFGKKVINGVLEDDLLFYKRMGGLATIFGAIVQTPVHGESKHPCGPVKGWELMSHTLNLEPVPGVTAIILADFLNVAGHRMSAVYKLQFVKLLKCIRAQLFPRIGAGMPVVRLEEVVDGGLRSGGMMNVPKGYIATVIKPN